MKTIKLIATAVAASAMATSAMAADLGGDCCADLEERVAELEATTARKGNRKVSLTISGQVNQAVMFWDDGAESNVYVVDNSISSSRFRFIGKAQITPDWSAGYYLEIEAFTAASSAVNQDNDDAVSSSANSNAVNVRQSNWWIESKQLGRVTVGQGSPATDDIILADVEGAGPAGYSDITQMGGGMFLRSNNGTLVTGTTFAEFSPGLDTSRRNIVRYDSPTFGGFKVVAAFGEDDYWDVALWWSGKIGDQITYAGGIGYLQNSCENPASTCEQISGVSDYNEFKGSASFLHNPTGLFITGAFVHREYDAVNRPDFEYWYLRGGLVAKSMLPLGKTVFWGEYGNGDDGITGLAEAGFTTVTDSEVENWGLGITQHIDAAAMELFVMYRNMSVDVSGTGGNAAALAGFEDLQLVVTGARIKF